jgi:hypothetical protein
MAEDFIKELLDTLTYGVGKAPGTKIRIQFYYYKGIIESAKSYPSLNAELQEYIMICLVLTVFNVIIIRPLSGVNRFYKLTKPLGVQSISIRSGNLSSIDIQKLRNTVTNFENVLRQVNISHKRLYFSSPEDFIKRMEYASTLNNDMWSDNDDEGEGI